ncbi:hypothetical protein ACFCQI_14060 [Rhodanobacter sp. FW102-FHT14D06]|uniref:Uncharacterized protein n=2 Tax=unclassified Rhodanobacter TaxID=2621553 RepID=A0AB74UUF9_9GAMM
MGKYQIIPTTMDAAIDTLHLDRKQAFTPALQDRIFSEYLIVDKRPEVQGYITGQPGVTLEAAQHSLSQEWASFGDPQNAGRSHYPPPNHASITLAQSESVLNQMRASYQNDIGRGLSPAEAWKDVTASNHAQSSSRSHNAASSQHLAQQGDYSTAVQTVQFNLIALGYRDTQGPPVKASPTAYMPPSTHCQKASRLPNVPRMKRRAGRPMPLTP